MGGDGGLLWDGDGLVVWMFGVFADFEIFGDSFIRVRLID